MSVACSVGNCYFHHIPKQVKPDKTTKRVSSQVDASVGHFHYFIMWCHSAVEAKEECSGVGECSYAVTIKHFHLFFVAFMPWTVSACTKIQQNTNNIKPRGSYNLPGYNNRPDRLIVARGPPLVHAGPHHIKVKLVSNSVWNDTLRWGAKLFSFLTESICYHLSLRVNLSMTYALKTSYLFSLHFKTPVCLIGFALHKYLVKVMTAS